MPDFTARFSAGVTATVWDDHAGLGVSRINPPLTRPSKFQKATVGVLVSIRATWNGIDAPTDAALVAAGSGLFSSDFAEHPCPYPIVPTGVGGSSSIQTFIPPVAGHYLWVLRHANGGAIALPFDAE